MRGKHDNNIIDLFNSRIIPAHAGQTRRSAELRVRTSDHPRACGANGVVTMPVTDVDGSSPRMRGKRRIHGHRRHPDRIIPAHAGQTHVGPVSVCNEPDHPRACGANDAEIFSRHCLPGSSPRMRGKRRHDQHQRLAARIIPAHAGQTRLADRQGGELPDHPRACGAN